jgi:hypothetical protein
MSDRITFRLNPSDATNLRAILTTLRTAGRVGAFVDRSAIVRAALVAAAELARQGALVDVLAAVTKRGLGT